MLCISFFVSVSLVSLISPFTHPSAVASLERGFQASFNLVGYDWVSQ